MKREEWLQIRVHAKEKQEARRLADDLDIGMSQLVRVCLQFMSDNRQIAKALTNGNKLK